MWKSDTTECIVHLYTVRHSLRQRKYPTSKHIVCEFPLASYTLIAKHAKTIVKYKKQKLYNEVFHVTFSAVHSSSHQGQHSHENSKDFVVYFFTALIKHEICMIYKKCIVSVSYFMACFMKTFAKYEKCIAGL